MMGYTFAIGAVVVLALAFLLFRFFGKAKSTEDRADYRKGTTYAEPQAEETAPPSTRHLDPHRKQQNQRP